MPMRRAGSLSGLNWKCLGQVAVNTGAWILAIGFPFLRAANFFYSPLDSLSATILERGS
jgi:hypothetical protein